MVDHISPQRRSWLMSRVRGKHTSPEMRVRRIAHALGLRFRLHRKNLSGKPDLVFPKHKVVILVHGCFWHRHAGCPKASIPKSRPTFWEEKFSRNVKRDRLNKEDLVARGWNVITIWECQTKDEALIMRALRPMLDEGGSHGEVN